MIIRTADRPCSHIQKPRLTDPEFAAPEIEAGACRHVQVTTFLAEKHSALVNVNNEATPCGSLAFEVCHKSPLYFQEVCLNAEISHFLSVLKCYCMMI